MESLNVQDLQIGKIFKGMLVFDNGEKMLARFVRENQDSFFVFAKGKRKSGTRLLVSDPVYKKIGRYGVVDGSYKIVGIEVKTQSENDKKKKWERSLNKAIKMLKESGLWKNELKRLELIQNIGYDKMHKAYKITQTDFSEDYYENQELGIWEIKQIDTRLISINSRNEDYVNINISMYGKPLKIKKMYFGKLYNERSLKLIAEALRENKEFSIMERDNYDVSFKFHPDKKEAFYSEEYKGCGNGHYYIALNATHALFIEDD